MPLSSIITFTITVATTCSSMPLSSIITFTITISTSMTTLALLRVTTEKAGHEAGYDPSPYSLLVSSPVFTPLSSRPPDPPVLVHTRAGHRRRLCTMPIAAQTSTCRDAPLQSPTACLIALQSIAPFHDNASRLIAKENHPLVDLVSSLV